MITKVAGGRWLLLGGAIAMVAMDAAQAQPLLDCSCLQKQGVLFTNACCGVIPDLCLVASNCYSTTVVPPPGFTCTQNPPPGTPVCSSTPITFTLIENLTGNSAFCTVTFNTGVSTNVFTALCPPTQVLPCSATNWTFGPPGWTNPCCTAGIVTNLVSVVTNWPLITTTWTLIDGCGVADTCSQTIAFFDLNNGGPCHCVGITCPPDIVLQTCLPPSSSAGGFTNVSYPLPVVTNYCIGTITNIVCAPPSGSPFPVGTNTVACTAYDNLGNSATCTFSIVVLGDTTPPIITCPPPQTNVCGSAWAPLKPTAVDACCGASVTVSLIAAFTNTFAACDDLITFKWVATDCNGNQSPPCTSIVHLIDPIPPVISCRGNYTIPCGTPLLPPLATDNCCPNPTVSMLNVITNGTPPCNYTLTITWQAQDCCTNTAACTEVVTIIDTTPPALTCAPNKTIECGDPWTFDPPAVFDACCGTNVTVTIIGTTTNTSLSPCLTIATRQWQATDCCGNASPLCGQTVTIVDTTPPVVTCAPNKTVQCGSAWTFDPPAALDACCGTNLTLSILSTVTNNFGQCPGTITRTWQATDCCSNSSICSQTITNVDNTPPTITCAPNQTVQCGSVWSFAPPTAVDACCANVAITIASLNTNSPAPCQNIITVGWRATDCCGNSAFCTNSVTVLDTIPPVITCRSNYIVQCGSPIVPPPASDNCCPNPLVTMLNVLTNSATQCNQSLTITWQAQDCCTNTATCVETISIVDTTPPVVTCASNKTVQCGSNWSFDTPTAVDVCCGTNVTITVLATTPLLGPACARFQIRVWQATDCCSNSVTCSQRVTMIDTNPPIITCAPNITNNFGAPWSFTSPTATDLCCGTNVTITVIATTTNYDGVNCRMIHSRLYRATDCCGNFSLCTQTVAIQYGPPPNDICANAISLVVNAPYICGYSICATPTPNGTPLVPAPCGSSASSPDVWYSVVPICTGPITVDTCTPCPGQPPFDTVLSAYTGNCQFPGSLTQVAGIGCNDNACGLQSSITFNAFAGQPYLLRVAGAANAVGYFSIRAQQTASTPANDLVQNAIAINPGNPAVCPGTTVCATPSSPGSLIPGPCGNSLYTPDVWYKYTPLCNEQITVDTCGNCQACNGCLAFAPFNTVLSVYTGNPAGALNQVPGACNDDATNGPCAGSPQSRVTFNGTGGVTYYIRVSGAGPGTVGLFRLNLSIVPLNVPPNDFCAAATPITPGVYSWTDCNATPDGPGSCLGGGFLPNIWFKYTPNCSGTVSAFNCTLGFFSFDMWTGSCGALIPGGCVGGFAGNAPACPGALSGGFVFSATAGTTYYFRLSSVGAITNGGTLTLTGPNPVAPTCPPPGPCNPNNTRYFRITGTPNCVKWGWSITAPCCMTLQNTNAGPVCAGNADNLAAAFVSSINGTAAAAGCSGITATAYPDPSNPGRFSICANCAGANAFNLAVGAAVVPPTFYCVVPNPTPGPYVNIPVSWCSFNPDIEEIRLSGHDLNNNGVDDAFDIEMGTSQDVNGNGIPDEVENCLPPTLASEPQSQLVEPGAPVTLTVALGGGSTPLTYSWSRHGSPVSDGPNISGATTASLSINALTAADAGDYSVLVSNACGSVVTVPATISSVTPVLPILYDMNLSDGWFRFTVETRIGFDYRIEFKNNLEDPAWTTLETVPGTGQPELVLDSEPLPQKRFYRVIEQPHQ